MKQLISFFFSPLKEGVRWNVCWKGCIICIISINSYIYPVVFFLYTTGVSIGFAQKSKSIPSEKPKLVIGIIVDMMRYDYIYRYWDKFETDGFKRLINEGTFCKNANYNYLFTQTGAGHATIFTGTTPSYHGIISNSWYLRLKDKIVYCTEDDKVKTVGSDSNEGQASPKHLLTTNLGDELKLSNKQKSKVIGIALKSYASILSAGHSADAAYWFDNKTGNWITSSFYQDSLPGWVKEFNNKKFPDLYIQREWLTLLPIEQYTESLEDDNPYEAGFGKQLRTFPHNLNNLKKITTRYNILKSTPFGNTLTKDFAIAAIVNEELGKDQYTDLLVCSFSSTDYVGHLFGPTSIEVEDIYLRLDKEIAHFLNFIDDYIGKENVLLFLTADHGAVNIPQYLKDLKIPAGYFNNKSAITLLKAYLNAIYGQGEWVSAYNEQQLYLNHNLIEDSKISLEEIQTNTAQFIIQFTGVANAITATTLQTTNFTKGIFEKMQNSYNQKRSGDVIINLEPGWLEQTEMSTSHNTAYRYDTHVPLIWYGWKINRSIITRPILITDIAPTIATFLNISFPNGCTGEPIRELTE